MMDNTRVIGGRMPPQGDRGGITSAVGNTPLVAMTRLYDAMPVRVFGKLETLNPAGSIKDRPALEMVQHAIRSGEVVPGRTTIVESSSGNLGIALSQVCRELGLRFVCVVDRRTTPTNIAIMRLYGTEVEVVDEVDPHSGDYLPVRLRRVRELVSSIPDAFWPDQYANVHNAGAHRQTMAEIVKDLAAAGSEPDYLLGTVSSCGTLRGCADYVTEHGLDTRIVAVDAAGSAIFGGRSAPRLIPGHGSAIRPPLWREGMADTVVTVTDAETVLGCRRLVRREGVLAGGSSGAAVAALGKVMSRLRADATCVLIFPDRGDRYLDTVYDDDWVLANFGQELLDRISAIDLPEGAPC